MAVRADFYERYDAVLAKWPVPREAVDLAGRFGVTRVNVCGPGDGSPVTLIPGGRATSAGWYAWAAAIARMHRVFAVDLMGDAGRSVPDRAPIRSRGDLLTWLDDVLAGLGLKVTALAGHSYGGWLAARYAISRPGRVSRLVLVDPTDTLTPTRLGFRLRGVPLLLGPDRCRYRRFYQWETGGRAADPQFLDLWAGQFGGQSRFVWPKVPSPADLARLTMPVLVLAAERSRQNSAAALAAAARSLPDARVVVVAGATHFTVPHVVSPALIEFLQRR